MKNTTLKYLSLILLLFFLCCNNKLAEKVNASFNQSSNQDKPAKTNEENFKLIWFADMNIIRNSKNKIKRVGERLISISENKFDIGDSVNYNYNSQNQLMNEEVFTNKGQLKERTSYQYDSSNNLLKIISRNYDGGKPLIKEYIYNSLNQITKENDSADNSYKFIYDAKNYLMQKQLLNINDSVSETTYYSYDSLGNPLCILTKSNSGDTITIDYYKFNKLSQKVESEHHGQPYENVYRGRWYMKYNEVGDKIEEKARGLTIHYKYEYDKNDNWTKQYEYYDEDKTPNFLTTRKIEYFK